MRKLNINPVLSEFIRKQLPDEKEIFSALFSSGVMPIPIIYWHNPETDLDEILDGHHRYELHKSHGYEFETFERKDITNIFQAKQFIIYHQLGKRNIDKPFRAEYLRRAYSAKRDEKEFLNPTKKVTVLEVVKEVAQAAEVSERTVYRALSEPEETPPDKLEQAIEAFKEQKKDYERRIQKRKEQLTKEFIAECRATAREPEESDEEELREKLEKEFEAEAEELAQKSDEIDELRADKQRAKADTNQVGGREKSADGEKRKRKFSRKKEALKQKKNSLRTFLTVLGKCQTAYGNIEGYFDDLPKVPFKALFEAVEGLQLEMVKGDKKR